MAAKNTVQVLIDGKIVSLAGYENPEYLQMVCTYLNKKISELKTIPNYNRLALDTRTNLLALNIADDYFKAKNQVDMLEQDIEAKDKEAYEAKDDLVGTKLQMDTLSYELEAAKAEKNSALSELTRIRQEKAELEAKVSELNKELDELLKK